MKRSIKIALIAFAAIIVIVIGTIITMNILNDENMDANDNYKEKDFKNFYKLSILNKKGRRCRL